MTGSQILNVIMLRLGTGSGVTSINTELDGVLYDITSRADFYTALSTFETVSDTYEYDEPDALKRIYECSISGLGLLEKKTYRDYLNAVADGSAATPGEPLYVARRRGKLYVWPVPDQAYSIEVDYAGFHPSEWSEVALGPEFNEAIFEGVLAALYRGQLFEKLRLNKKNISGDNLDEFVTDGTNNTVTDQDLAGESLEYSFDNTFPEIRRHAQAYEREIKKLIQNLDMDIETVLVEYRDI
ncbi:MAG: hypothetical protein K9M75_01530 [Phycisphaerae bacterium]|nr:hypothetical protein [Phycisphaerae bacterium]